MNRPCSYICLICCIWTLRVCVWATLHVFLFRVILTYVLLSDIHQLILTMFNHPNRISGLKVNVLSHNICRHAFVRINTDIVGSWQELSMAQVRCFFFFFWFNILCWFLCCNFLFLFYIWIKSDFIVGFVCCIIRCCCLIVGVWAFRSGIHLVLLAIYSAAMSIFRSYFITWNHLIWNKWLVFTDLFFPNMKRKEWGVLLFCSDKHWVMGVMFLTYDAHVHCSFVGMPNRIE